MRRAGGEGLKRALFLLRIYKEKPKARGGGRSRRPANTHINSHTRTEKHSHARKDPDIHTFTCTCMLMKREREKEWVSGGGVAVSKIFFSFIIHFLLEFVRWKCHKSCLIDSYDKIDWLELLNHALTLSRKKEIGYIVYWPIPILLKKYILKSVKNGYFFINFEKKIEYFIRKEATPTGFGISTYETARIGR